MRFFSLSLSFLATTCLATNNSSENSPPTDFELETLSKNLQMYVNFDRNYFTDLESKKVSIEAASLMSLTELKRLERDSEASLIKAQNENVFREESVCIANSKLAKLFKLEKVLNVEQAIFDAWRNSGLSGSKFMDLAKEAMKHNPEYVKLLADYSSIWHMRNGDPSQNVESPDAKNHFCQYLAINFIYHGLTILNASDSSEFEECVRSESLNGIRLLSKNIATSYRYSKEVLIDAITTSSIDTDRTEGNKIALMANSFNKEILVAWEEERLESIQKELSVHRIKFDVKSALKSKKANKVYRAYQKCILKAGNNAELKNLCGAVLFHIRNVSEYKKTLEDLKNMFNYTTDSECSLMLRDVLEPAIVLINSKRIKRDLSNDDLVLKLKNYGIELNNVTLDQKTILQREDDKLCNRMILVQKSRDFLKHKKDSAYIRNAYNEMTKEFRSSVDISLAFNIVRKVVQELENDSESRKCSFDFDRRVLTFQTPEMLEILLEIQQSNHACSILIDFCEKLIAVKSISTALAYSEEQAKAHGISYITKYSGINRRIFSDCGWGKKLLCCS